MTPHSRYSAAALVVRPGSDGTVEQVTEAATTPFRQALRRYAASLLVGIVAVSGCGEPELTPDQVRAGGRTVQLHAPADCITWDGCLAGLLNIERGTDVQAAVDADGSFAILSEPDADWGVEADGGTRRIRTAEVEPGRYVVTLTTASGLSQFRLEVRP